MPFSPTDQSTWRPKTYDVEVTSRCNLGCAYCYLGQSGVGDMTPETADCVVELLRARVRSGGECELNLYGGEPFLNFPVVQRLVRRCPGPTACSIFTNGATASREQIAWCIRHGVVPRRSTAGCPDAAIITRPGDYTDRWLAEGRLWQDFAFGRRLTVTPDTAIHVRSSLEWLHQNGYYGAVDIATDDYATWSEYACRSLEGCMWELASEFVQQWDVGCVFGVENFANFGRTLFGQGDLRVVGCGAAHNTWGITWGGLIVPCHRFFRDGAYASTSIACHVAGGAPVAFPDSVVSTVGLWSQGWARDECRDCPALQCCPGGCLHVSARAGSLTAAPPMHKCRFTRTYADIARWIQSRISAEWWDAQPTPCTFTKG